MTRRGSAGFDHVVVGGGAAGCVLAARLSEDGATRVLLLEAGPAARRPEVAVPATYPLLFGTSRDWRHVTAAQDRLGGRQLSWPRGRMLGGSSAMNDMVYVRGNRADYDAWRDAGNAGWGYEDVLPYFRRSEDNERGSSPFHGVGGPQAVSDPRYVHPRTEQLVAAAEQTGLRRTDDFNGARQEGVGLHQLTQRDGVRCSAADAYLRPARARPNLTVVPGATVTRVLVRDGAARGVRFRRRGREREVRVDGEVLLCGGAVNTPQLLMLSGVGPADHLRAHGITPVTDLPGVGAGLQDHLMVPVSWRSREPASMLDARRLPAVLRYTAGRRGPLAGNLGQAGAFLRGDGGPGAPDLQLVLMPILLTGVRDSGVVPPTEHGYAVVAVCLQPESRGSVRLRSADPLLPPLVQPRYLSAPADEETLVRGVERCLEIGSAPALRPVRRDRVTPRSTAPEDLRRHVRAMADTMFHPVGTCRMGTDPGAVVDAALRVHGVDRLRVVDASVMPAIPRGNTYAPTVVVAERAADLVRGAPAPAGAGSAPAPAAARR
ncbi:GMC family oxidoreductase [Geodermatophilus sp. SYSU D00742]